MPWEEYVHTRVATVVGIQPAGLHQADTFGFMKSRLGKSDFSSVSIYGLHISQFWSRPVVETTFVRWLEDVDLTAPGLMQLPGKDYILRITELQKSLEKSIKEYLERAAKDDSI
jgi:hypothetical protein